MRSHGTHSTTPKLEARYPELRVADKHVEPTLKIMSMTKKQLELRKFRVNDQLYFRMQYTAFNRKRYLASIGQQRYNRWENNPVAKLSTKESYLPAKRKVSRGTVS